MKEVVLKWRGRDILVRYQVISRNNFLYAIVVDKNGRETHLHRRQEENRWVWRGGIYNKWPDDLIELLSDFFNKQTPENKTTGDPWRPRGEY